MLSVAMMLVSSHHARADVGNQLVAGFTQGVIRHFMGGYEQLVIVVIRWRQRFTDSCSGIIVVRRMPSSIVRRGSG